VLPIDAFDLSPDDVRARFSWALRQGNPRWLWPEVTKQGWRDALFEIEDITRQILLNGRAKGAFTRSSDDLCVAAFTSGMGPLLGYWGARGKFEAPAGVLAVFDLHYRNTSLRMAAIAQHATEAVGSLAERGISVTALKGLQTAFEYFPSPGTRPMSDIDLLIDPADKAAAGEVLAGLGYLAGRVAPVAPPQQAWRKPAVSPHPRSLMLNHREDPWSIDLQTALSRRYSTGAKWIELDRLPILAPREDWAISPSAKALSPVPLVLHLACHASCGFENLMLLRLTELALVIRKGEREGRFSWANLMALADETGALPHAYPALCLTERLCPGTVPEAVLRSGEMQAPAAVQRVVRRLRPASAQRVTRCSLEERFMWTTSIPRLVRQLVLDALPRHVSPSELLWIYQMRMWRLMRGTFTRTAPEAF
jgi:hypothetical protein